MVVELKISEVQFIEELYPRFKFDDKTVDQYRLNIDNLPPIKVQKAEKILIDGYHRIVAHQLEGRETIKAELEDVPREQVLWLAVKYNSTHGLQLSNTEKRNLARSFYQNNHTQLSEIAEVLAVSQSVVYEWLNSILKDEREEENKLILDLYLSCYTEPEIAEKLRKSQPAITKKLDKIKSITFSNFGESYSSPPLSKHIYDVWDFTQCEEEYGTKGYPGRTPGQLVEGVLYYYTEPFDIVVDPMAGGGTTVDVCKKMFRRVMAFDINPIEAKGIKKWDVKDGFHPDCRRPHFKPKLIYLDPPYFNKKDGEYVEGSISNLSRIGFIEALSLFAKQCFDLLPIDGRVVLLLSNYVDYENHRNSIWTDDIAKDFKYYGFNIEMKIQTPLTSQQYRAPDVSYAKEHKRILVISRDLIIFRK